MTRTTEQIKTEWLVLQIQSGSAKAQEVLAALWYPLLRRYARALLQHREDAHDAVQETMLAMTNGIHFLRDPATFPLWVYRVLHRRCMDIHRRRKRQGKDSDAEIDNALQEDAHDPDPGQSSDIGKAMQKLPRDSYLVLQLYYLHDFSVQEIAEITGVAAGTVKSRLFNARATLKQHLGGYEHE